MADTPDFEELYKDLQEAAEKKAEAAVHTKSLQPVKKEKPAEDEVNRFIRDFVTLGTPACGLLCAVIGIALAALLLTVGFGKTLLIALFGAVGGFAGGVFDKSQWLKNVINRLFPPKQ